jgi:hypothetical protein
LPNLIQTRPPNQLARYGYRFFDGKEMLANLLLCFSPFIASGLFLEFLGRHIGPALSMRASRSIGIAPGRATFLNTFAERWP